MDYWTFLKFNVLGGVLWGVGLTTLGYYLGQVEFVKSNLEPVLLAIVALSVLPIVAELARGRRRRRPAGDPTLVMQRRSRGLAAAMVAIGALALLLVADAWA